MNQLHDAKDLPWRRGNGRAAALSRRSYLQSHARRWWADGRVSVGFRSRVRSGPAVRIGRLAYYTAS